MASTYVEDSFTAAVGLLQLPLASMGKADFGLQLAIISCFDSIISSFAVFHRVR